MMGTYTDFQLYGAVRANSLSTRQRENALNTVGAVFEKFEKWSKQTTENEVYLDAEPQLQILSGMGYSVELEDFLNTVEDRIEEMLEEDGDLAIQLGRTAYDSMCAVGYDCSGFEWMVCYE